MSWKHDTKIKTARTRQSESVLVQKPLICFVYAFFAVTVHAYIQFVSEVLSFVFFVFCASFQSVSEFRSFGVVRFVFDCSCVQLTSFRISVVHVFNLFQNSCRFVCLLSWLQPVSELLPLFLLSVHVFNQFLIIVGPLVVHAVSPQSGLA
jgi:hypothetical protein